MTNEKQHKIRIFSTPTCPYCVALKLFLDEQGFKYEHLDVSANDEAREEMIKESGQMGVPVIEIDGNWIVGFDRAKIVELLGIKE